MFFSRKSALPALHHLLARRAVAVCRAGGPGQGGFRGAHVEAVPRAAARRQGGGHGGKAGAQGGQGLEERVKVRPGRGLLGGESGRLAALAAASFTNPVALPPHPPPCRRSYIAICLKRHADQVGSAAWTEHARGPAFSSLWDSTHPSPAAAARVGGGGGRLLRRSKRLACCHRGWRGLLLVQLAGGRQVRGI